MTAGADLSREHCHGWCLVLAVSLASLCLGLSACSDPPVGEDEDETGAEADEGESDGDADGDGADAGGELGDEQLCLEWCLSGMASQCPSWAGNDLCYTRCMDDLAENAGSSCEAEHRATVACEAGASDRVEGYCESLGCMDVYKHEDICKGYCDHLGGIPSGGGGATECDWKTYCDGYGFDFAASCTAGGDVTHCECEINDELVAECEMEAIPEFGCGDVNMFHSCCGDYFQAALFP
ncbi:hypothetical protein G6O69_24020 [Pseudenhygromyxa sp. WMMC2535]|uniref:hypothetical protein n=1 Tax=Pseudenhygromyxa sp. WMMC2535 TaxID=2712867 RepID=UPI001556FD51|nr:hypothetical protein [Pseudenhygromyxa sp. WMMC2535]NVB40928.1 hypothetical protein [Pseudenhygromyxa sp. WMMC2535]